MIIIGVDPGVAKSGFGVINKIQNLKSKNQNRLKCLNYGVIKTTPSSTTPERLKRLNDELKKLIKKYKPKVLAVENVYFFKNLKTAMPVSQAKGVILLTAAQKNIPVCEFTPLQVKITIAGYGGAKKKQVQKMIKVLLNLKDVPEPDDAADALAIAVCASRLPPPKSF